MAQITRYCTSRIHELSRGEHVESLADLERVVCEKLNLVIEEIESDDDIEKLVQKYAVGDKDPAIASIRTHFDSDIFGTTFLRRKHHPGDRTATSPSSIAAVPKGIGDTSRDGTRSPTS